MFKLNEKGIVAQALILLVLAAGIAGGVYLVTHPQIFKSKAGGGAIFFRQVNGDPLPRTAEGVAQTTSPTFQVELNSTLGPPVFSSPTPTSSPASNSNGIGTTAPLGVGSSVLGVGTTAPTQISGTVSYKIAENPTDLDKAAEVVYTSDQLVFNYTLSPKNQTPGIKTIFVEFKDVSGKTDRQSAQIELVAPSVFGKAIRLTNTDGKGSNRIEIFNQDVVGLNQLNAITAEAWVKPTPNTDGLVFLKSKGSGNNPTDYQYYMSVRKDNSVMFCFRITTSAGSMCSNISLNSYPSANGWYHLAMVFDTGKLGIFINGKGGITQTIPNALLDNSLTGTLYIGGTPDNLSSLNTDYKGFNGDIDELMFSNNARYIKEFIPPIQPFSEDAHTLALWHYDGNMADSVNRKTGQITGNIPFIDSSVGGIVSSPTPAPTSSRRVFVTDSAYNGNLQSAGGKFGLGDATSGLDGADKVCQGSAEIAKLGGTWKAWLSDSSTSAASRLIHSSDPYKLLDGRVIADNWDDLTDGTLQNPIEITEFGTKLAPPSNCSYCSFGFPWTNTNNEGNPVNSNANRICNNFTSSAATGDTTSFRQGYAFGTSPSQWTIYPVTSDCNTANELYCFEQTTTTSPIPTPAPTIEPTPTATPVNVGVGNPTGGGSTPTQTTRTIKYFRYAESVAGLSNANWNTYYQGVPVAYEFKDLTTWPKFIFVEFADVYQQTIPINGQSYVTSSAINLLEPTPTTVPVVNNPNTPSPLPNDGPNCPIENPSNYDIGTLYTMCSVNQLARFDLKWLVDFPNNILIDIGTKKGDLGGFLANFSSERLLGLKNDTTHVDYTGSGFSIEILKQLPDWRKQQFSTEVQNQLK